MGQNNRNQTQSPPLSNESQSTLHRPSNIGGNKDTPIQPTLVQKSVEKCRRLQIVLSGQLECPPVDTKRLLAANILVDLHSLTWMNMLVLHEPVWLVGTCYGLDLGQILLECVLYLLVLQPDQKVHTSLQSA